MSAWDIDELLRLGAHPYKRSSGSPRVFRQPPTEGAVRVRLVDSARKTAQFAGFSDSVALDGDTRACSSLLTGSAASERKRRG
jgi:hypothetical protein